MSCVYCLRRFINFRNGIKGGPCFYDMGIPHSHCWSSVLRPHFRYRHFWSYSYSISVILLCSCETASFSHLTKFKNMKYVLYLIKRVLKVSTKTFSSFSNVAMLASLINLSICHSLPCYHCLFQMLPVPNKLARW